MDVILLNDVEKLGLRGDVVSVARGYARNFLLPRGLAEVATPAKVAELAKRDSLRARHEARTAEQGQQVADRLRGAVLRFDVRSGPTGTLFGSVTPSEIADKIWSERKVRVDRRKIRLDEPLKRVGRYAVPIEVFEGIVVEVETLVVPEGGELPPEEPEAASDLEQAGTASEPAGPSEAVEPPLEGELEAQ
jgi:large subunit ribosomal protein L9